MNAPEPSRRRACAAASRGPARREIGVHGKARGADRPHPAALGSPHTHPSITTDYCRADPAKVVFRLARLALVCAASAGGACAASDPVGALAAAASASLDVDRPCLSGRWLRVEDGDAIVVAADNRCGRPLTCDVHLTLNTSPGPDLYLDCVNQALHGGRSEALCRWTGQPRVAGGSGSMACR